MISTEPSRATTSTSGPRLVQLKDICDRITKGSTPTSYGFKYTREGIRFIKAENIDRNGLASTTTDYIDEATNEFLKRSILQEHDILFSIAGTIGRVGVIRPTDLPANTNQALAIIRLLPGIIEQRYLFYYLKSDAIQKYALKRIVGMGRANLSLTNIGEFAVPLVSLDQQKQIVAEIEKQSSRLDEAIANLKRVKANLKRYKASVLKAAVEGKLTDDWRKQHPNLEPASKLLERILAERRAKWNGRGKYKEPTAPDTSDLPELPEKWKWTNLDQLAEVGTGATPKRGKPQYYAGGHIPWITSSALNWEHVNKANEFVTDTALRETNLTVYPPGTLLLAMYGEGRTRGKCSELRIHATTNQAIAAIQCDDKVRDYIKLAIWNQYEDLRRTASGGVQPNLNLSLVRVITIPLPPGTEQSSIVTEAERRLSVIEELEAAVQANLTRAERMRQSILSNVFAGKLVCANISQSGERSADIQMAKSLE